jgi:hypothetical protein
VRIHCNELEDYGSTSPVLIAYRTIPAMPFAFSLSLILAL